MRAKIARLEHQKAGARLVDLLFIVNSFPPSSQRQAVVNGSLVDCSAAGSKPSRAAGFRQVFLPARVGASLRRRLHCRQKAVQ
jgi:hypothetical protein